MARSTYIYHVRRIKCGTLLASGTVKHEMHTLFENNPEYPRDTVVLSRVKDGKICDEEVIPWDVEFNVQGTVTGRSEASKPNAEEVARKLSEQFRRNGNYDGKGFYR